MGQTTHTEAKSQFWWHRLSLSLDAQRAETKSLQRCTAHAQQLGPLHSFNIHKRYIQM